MKNGIIKMLALLLLGTATLSGCAIENQNNRHRRNNDRYHHDRNDDRDHHYRNY
jgi:hypothetical protein